MSSSPTPQDVDPPCRDDPEMFFTNAGRNQVRIAEAKRICWEECDFQDRCLNYGVEFNVQGVWGGTDEDERKAIRDRLRIVAKPIVWDLPRSAYGRWSA